MATVYLARDLRHDRPVALKVLRAELSAILGGERFLREIRLTAAQPGHMESANPQRWARVRRELAWNPL
jgi:serine/threonine protein kinase